MKNFFWRVGRLWCAGIILLLLRLTQNRSGFDPATGLSIHSLPGAAALVILGLCAAAELALSFRNHGEKSEFRAQFAPPEKELLAAVLGSLLLAAGGILLALQGFQTGDIAAGAAGVLAVAAGAGVLLLNRGARAGGELSVLLLIPAMLFAVFYVLAVYLPAEDDPVFMRYYLPVLTAAMVAYAFSELAGFLRKESSPRGFLFAGDLTVVLCLMAIADGTLAQALLLAGCALILSVYLLLCRNEAPSPEREAQ